MTCRDCVYLETDAPRAKLRPGAAYSCNFEPPLPPLPTSITTAFDFSWPPQGRWIGPDDGANCPCFKAIEPPPKAKRTKPGPVTTPTEPLDYTDDEFKADQWAISNGLDVILPDGTRVFGPDESDGDGR